MKSQPAYCRPIINGPLLILISPFIGAISYIVISSTSAPHALVLVGVISLTVTALVLFSGRVVGALLVALLELALYGNFVAARETPRKILLFGTTLPTTNVEVSCNGVVLGHTPFRITESELRAKVGPWPVPPDQPRIDWGPVASWEDDGSNDRYGSAQFYYVPYDFEPRFDLRRTNETQDWRWATGGDDVAREIIAGTKHWWHFDQTGCLGLATRSNFAGGSSGNSLESTHQFNPQIEFPSVEPHLDRLVALLHAEGGRPSQAWLAHWQKYERLLFVPAWQRAERDAELRTAIETAVRYEFEIPESPTLEDAERVLDTVMDRARQAGRFMVHSPESVAIDLMGTHAPAAITRLCNGADNALARIAPSGRASTDEWTVWYGVDSGPAASFPLYYAIARYRPPTLFNALVYAAARNPYLLQLVARYQRPEADRIIQDYLRDLAWPSLAGADFQSKLSGAMELIVAAPNPDLEAFYRQVLVEQVGRNDWGRVLRYIDSRIGAPGMDQGELGSWIFHFAPLDEHEKQNALLEIDDPQISTYLSLLVARNPSLREDILETLRVNGNSGATAFLVQCAELSPTDPGKALDALASIGNAEARDFLTRWWNQRPKRRDDVLDALSKAATHGRNVGWSAAMIQQADTPQLRAQAVPLLIEIGSPDAMTTVNQWAALHPIVAQAVGLATSAKEEAADRRREVLRQARALIAGELMPDALLDAQPTWVWNGHDYVADGI